jgi:hypothetical protein
MLIISFDGELTLDGELNKSNSDDTKALNRLESQMLEDDSTVDSLEDEDYQSSLTSRKQADFLQGVVSRKRESSAWYQVLRHVLLSDDAKSEDNDLNNLNRKDAEELSKLQRSDSGGREESELLKKQGCVGSNSSTPCWSMTLRQTRTEEDHTKKDVDVNAIFRQSHPTLKKNKILKAYPNRTRSVSDMYAEEETKSDAGIVDIDSPDWSYTSFPRFICSSTSKKYD